MMWSTGLPIISLFYITIIIFVFFSKETIKNSSTKTYSYLIIINFIGLILHVLLGIFIPIYNNSFITMLISRLYLIDLLLWFTLFTLYVLYITFGKNKHLTINKFKIAIYIIFILTFILTIKFPLYIYNDINYVYTYGPSVILLYINAILYVIACICIVLRNSGTLKSKKYLPLLMLLILGSFVMVIQWFCPYTVLMTPFESFMTMLMYFTIENPDVKMLEEFKIAKDRAEKANKEKEIFLYNLTNDIRTPLFNIKKSSSWINENIDNIDKTSIKEGMYYINNNASMVLDKVNNVLDITNMEITNIKVYNTKYNIRLVLDELYKIYSSKVNNNVKLNFNIDSNIPEYLNGDSLRLKQLLTIILDNSVKYTNKGYVELNLNTIVKKGVCRLIITLDDTGIGIKASDIENIFNKNNQNYNSLDKIDDKKKNLAIAKSIATLLGGILLLESEIGKGTTITLVLDQKIYEEKSDSLVKIENDITSYISKKKVMVISEDIDYLEILVKKLSKYDIDVIKMNLASYGLEHVRLNKECDLIIMDEELKHLSSLEILNKFKMIPNFNIDIAILTNNPSNNYIEDGFTYVLNRKLDTKELDSLIDGIE